MYKNISKKILSFLFVFTLFFISLSSVKAETATIMSDNAKIRDFTIGGSYTTRFWAWNSGDSALNPTTDGANAFCLDPNNRTPSGLKGSGITSISNVSISEYTNDASKLEQIRLLLYYGIGGPGWEIASQNWYDITCGGNACANPVYALEHLFLSKVDGSCSRGKCSNYNFLAYEGNYNDLIAALREHNSHSETSVPDTFKVYLYNPGSAEQRIIYWTYQPPVSPPVEQKGYIEVKKRVTNRLGLRNTFDIDFCNGNQNIFTANDQPMTYVGNCTWRYGLDDGKPTLPLGSSYIVKETIPTNASTNSQFVFNKKVQTAKVIISNSVAANTVVDTNSSTAKNSTLISNDLRRCLVVRKIDTFSNTGVAGLRLILYRNTSVDPDTGKELLSQLEGTNDDGYAYFWDLDELLGNEYYIVKADTSHGDYTEEDGTKGEALIKNNTYEFEGEKYFSSAEIGYEYYDNNGDKKCSSAGAAASNEDYKLKDTPHKIDWYKTDEDGNKLSGAKFKVKVKDSDDNTIKYKIDQNGQPVIESGCYVYDPNGSSDGFESDANGYTCISYVDKDETYTVTETVPADFHTYNSTNSITISPTTMTKDNNNKLVKSAQTSKNTFVNIPTEFEFTKGVDGENENTDEIIKKISSIQLKKLRFNIYTTIDNIEYKVYVIKNSDGIYEYARLVRIDNGAIKMKRIDSADATSSIQLDDDKNFKIKYLPKGDYYIKEEGASINNNGTCDCDDNDCIPFYFPKGNVGTFRITYCSSVTAASSTTCKGYVDQTIVGTATSSYDNELTELNFTKKDFYSYGDANDVNGSAVSFEDTKERSDFDRIVFNVKDSQGNVLRFIKVGNNITDSNKKCLNDNDYSVYRYVPNEVYDTLTEEEKARVVTDLHTCGGHIKILGLCRGKTYKVEEVSVPEDSVYVKETDTNGNNPSVEYTIKCCEDDITIDSDTVVINDKPTRVRFEKRDSKYNYLIPDETTTFRVYQCPKNEVCHPADGITSNMKLMKFHNRAVINGDEEDPTDTEGLEGVEVYRTVSDSDLNNGTTGVSDLHPYKGILVLRYLPAGYNYVLLETVAPKNYTLPIGRSAETMFTVTNTTVNVEEVSVPNIPTSLIVRKYSDNGNLLTGAKFKIYKKDSCDSNIKASKQISNGLKDNYVVNLKTIRDGVYEVRPIEDTNTFTTCSGSDCNSISTNPETKLTYSTYLNTKGDFSNLVTESNTNLNLQEGEALIQYLEYGKCYIIEEVKAPNGYSLPENEDNRFVMINIDENNSYGFDTKDALINSPTPFTFYKYDEYNNLIDGAEFKLQKLNNDKVYEDITVTKEEKDDKFFYKVDKNTDNVIIETKNGQATVYYLEEGQYRIVEIKSPDGKELPKNPNIATFFVDSNGKVYGNSIISNKSKTEKIKVVPSAQAEFIVGIRTGQKIIKYGLIIAVLSIAISVLMFINNKSDKFDIKRGKNGKK